MSETAAHTTADAGRTEPVAFITKAALENWLKGDCPENHVLLRTGGDLRVALYMHPPEPTDELTGCREALRKATIKNAKSDAMIADLNDMVLRYAYRAEITSADLDPCPAPVMGSFEWYSGLGRRVTAADAWEIVLAWLAQYEQEEETFSLYRDDVVLDGVMSAGLRRDLSAMVKAAAAKGGV